MFDYSKTIFENSQDAIIVHNPDTTILEVNKAACDLFGFGREELIGRKIADFTETYQPLKKDNLEELRSNGYTIFERVVVRKDGTKVPVEISNSITSNDEGKLIIAIVRDLRDWFKVKMELMDSEERFRTFVEQSIDGILLLNEDGLVKEWNKAMETITGMKQEEAMGTPIWIIMERLEMAQGRDHKMTSQNFRARVERSVETGLSDFFNQVMEMDFIDRGGAIRSIRQVIFPVKREDRIWVGGIVQDYGEVKRYQKEILNGQAHLKAILDNVQIGVMVVDPSNHSVMDVNPAAAAMFGASRESIIGSTCHNFICPSEVGKCPVTDLGQKVECSERSFIRRDRSRSSIIKTVTTFLLDGRPMLLESFVDITERKKTEEKLRKSEEQLRLLASNLKDMIYVLDLVPKPKFRYVSSASNALLGYSPIELEIMEDPLELVHPDDIAELRGLLSVPGGAGSFEPRLRMRLRHKNGEYVWIDARNAALLGTDGGLRSLEGSARDISAEVRAKDELERTSRTDKMISSLSSELANLKTSGNSEGINRILARLGKFVRADRCYIYSLREDDGMMEMTHSWAAHDAEPGNMDPRTTVVTKIVDMAISLNLGEVLHIPDIREAANMDPESFRSLDQRGTKSLVIVPSLLGGTVRGYIGFESIKSAEWDGTEIRMLTVVSDMLSSILNRMRTEERLNMERERFAITLRSIGEGVITTDKDGNIILGNRAAEEMTGMNRYSMIGLHIKEVVGLADLEWDKVTSHDSGGPSLFEVRNLNGGRSQMEYRFTTLLGANDEDIGKVFVFRDVATDAKGEAVI